jgi:hypothetical protein
VARIRCLSNDPKVITEQRGPAVNVHSDFSIEGAKHFLGRQFIGLEEVERLAQTHRIMVFNLWRPLQTITKDPLAVCDLSSVDHSRDLMQSRFLLPNDNWNEGSGFVYNDQHRWFYLNSQQPDELLVFKQYDSAAATDGGIVPHSSFVDPDFVDNEARRSIEIKVYAVTPKDTPS